MHADLRQRVGQEMRAVAGGVDVIVVAVLECGPDREAPWSPRPSLVTSDGASQTGGDLAALEAELDLLIAHSHLLDPADCTDADICHILSAPQ